MNLVFDFGNTRTKGAVFEKNNIVESFVLDYSDIRKFADWINIPEVGKIGLTTVVNVPEGLKELFKSIEKPVISVNPRIALPVNLSYDTPETLGADRICNAVAGYSAYPGKNVLIIDLGTCNKYDFVDHRGNYQGGSIAPGFKMRLDAMHQFTENLPLINPGKTDVLIGKSTETSIKTGAYWGVVGEIKLLIGQYQSRFNDTIVLATGGNLKYFEKVLKNFIFADPNLTLKGLNSILNYQND